MNNKNLDNITWVCSISHTWYYLLWDCVQVLPCGNCHNCTIRWLSQKWHTANREQIRTSFFTKQQNNYELLVSRYLQYVCTLAEGSWSTTPRGCQWCSWEEEVELNRLRTVTPEAHHVVTYTEIGRCLMQCKQAHLQNLWIFPSHLDDNQTELTLQQKEEALANAIGCVSCLQHIQPKVDTFINVTLLLDLSGTRGPVCI